MPAPPNPPYSAGALSTPRMLNRWLDINKVSPLTRAKTYFTVPAFTVNFDWKGYSELVAAFNFSATHNFSLKLSTVALPLNPNYVACIMWIDSNLISYRYRLWSSDYEKFYFNIPQYTGQLIKENFRIEIWSVSPTSILSVTMTGAANANANGVYNYAASTDWNGPIYDLLYNAGNLRWLLGTTPEYVNYDLALFPFGLWQPSGSAAPSPYAYIASTASQATSFNIYTSVLQDYDYRYVYDAALVVAGAVITNFSIALPANLPLTFPVNAVPTTN